LNFYDFFEKEFEAFASEKVILIISYFYVFKQITRICETAFEEKEI
jgi:hypothetical protein